MRKRIMVNPIFVEIWIFINFSTTVIALPIKKEFETGSVDCVVFTSASTVKGFVEGTPGLDYTAVKAACIGKQTKAAADAYGMKTRMAKKATIESLIELVEEMKQEDC